MTGLFSLLGRLTVLSVLVSLLEKLTPQGSQAQSVRLAGGLMVMLTLVQGLSEWLL